MNGDRLEADLAGLSGHVEATAFDGPGRLPQSFRWFMEAQRGAALEDAAAKLREMEDDRTGVPLDIKWPAGTEHRPEEDAVLVDIMAVDELDGPRRLSVLLRPRPGSARGLGEVD